MWNCISNSSQCLQGHDFSDQPSLVVLCFLQDVQFNNDLLDFVCYGIIVARRNTAELV